MVADLRNTRERVDKMERKGTILYPYDLEHYPVVKYKELIEVSKPLFLLAPKGFGLAGKQADYFLEKPETGIAIIEEIEEAAKQAHSICILDAIEKVEVEDIKEVIVQACEANINVLYAAEPFTERGEIVRRICEQYKNSFTAVESNFPMELDWRRIQPEKKKINTPVVMVCGISPMTQKFELQIYLRKYFKKHKYSVSQIGSKITSGLFGFCSIAPYIFSCDTTEVRKIHTVNNMIKKIEEDENPDVIIIGVPGGILPLTAKHHFGYGVYAYEIFNAICPDFTILSLPNGEYTDEFYDNINKMSKYKFGIDIDAFFISSFTPISNSIITAELEFAYTKEKRNTSSLYKVFSNSSLQGDQLFKEIENKLLMYGKYGQL